jgi:MFS family permease
MTIVAPYHESVSAQERARKVRHRWEFVALLVVGGVINYLDRGTLSIGNTTIARELGFTPAEMGLLLSAFAWPYAIANLPAGYLVDRFGPKWIYTWAATLWSIVSMLTALVRSFPLFYGMRALLGVTESPFFTAGLKVATRWFAKDERSMPVSVINTGSQIANAIAPPLLTVLLLGLGWQGMFVTVGALGLVAVAIWLWRYRDPRPDEEALVKGIEVEEAAELEVAEREGNVGWLELFRLRNTWFMMLGAFGIFYTVWVYLTWLPSYLETSRGFSLAQVGGIAALPFLCGIVGVLAGGYLSTRLVQSGMPTLRARKIPIVGGALLSAAAVLPVAYVENTVLSIVLLCIGYFAAQVPIGVIWTLASDVADRRQVASLGSIQNFGGFLGAALAPAVTGFILQGSGNDFRIVFLVGGLLLVVGAVAYGVFVREPSVRQVPT